MISEIRNKTHFHTWGDYYGYPQCCIDEFVEDLKAGKSPGERNLDGNYSGFIPCRAHTTQVLNKDIKLGDLIRNRTCDTEFPNDGDAAKDSPIGRFLGN